MNLPNLTLRPGTAPTEGGAIGSYLIDLDTPAPAGGLTVNFNTDNSSAIFDTDFKLLPGAGLTDVSANSFTIAPGATTATLALVAFADTDTNPTETVTVNLTPGAGYSLVNHLQFAPKVDYLADLGAYSVGVGDFNDDGKTDLAVANSKSDTVSVLLRNATNTGFEPKIDYPTGSIPVSVSTADFNKDGKTDLVVANWQSNTVSVLLRNASNTGFDPKIDYATGKNPHSVSVGDFNNDGKMDLAVANENYSNTVSVLLRNVTNTGFDPKVDYSTGLTPMSVSVGDFNNDGKTDLAVANFDSNTVSILLRNATNTSFDPKIDYPVGHWPMSVRIGDFNGDGKTDLAVANKGSNTVSVLLRDATNTGFEPKVDYLTANGPSSVSKGDFNNDGKTDLAVANFYGDTVSVLLRNATNTGFEPKVDYATGSSSNDYSEPVSVNTGDFNNDGKTDLVLATRVSAVPVWLNTSSPSATLTIGDVINGTSGADLLTGGAGNDILNGGDGYDTAVYHSVRANFTVKKNGTYSSTYTVTDKTGAEGTDTLTNIENIRFTNTSIRLDTEGVPGQAYSLYQVAFNRTPDLTGLGFWIAALDNGATVETIANNFVNSPEFSTKYGINPSPETFLTQLYNSGLHRAYDQAGFDFWLGTLKSGANSQAAVLVQFSESHENQFVMIALIGNGIEYTPSAGT